MHRGYCADAYDDARDAGGRAREAMRERALVRAEHLARSAEIDVLLRHIREIPGYDRHIRGEMNAELRRAHMAARDGFLRSRGVRLCGRFMGRGRGPGAVARLLGLAGRLLWWLLMAAAVVVGLGPVAVHLLH